MKSERNTLILITSNFPFGTGEPYLASEIEYLAKKFNQIIIISNDTVSTVHQPLPENIKVVRLPYELTILEKTISLKHLFSNEFFKELKIIKNQYKQPISLIIIKTLLVTMQTGYKVVKFIKDILTEYNVDLTNLFLYSYWNNNMVYGIVKFKGQYTDVIAFTRAHRWDIYFEENAANYLPLRKSAIEALNAIFFISRQGRDYFASKMDITNNKLRISRLGIKNSYQPSFAAKHKPLEIISCSVVIDRKRIDLIVKALSQLNEYDIIWNHIGDGSELPEIKSLAEKLLGNKPNVKYEFLGYLSNDKIYEYYKNESIDIFLNVSSSEGVPVAIMETMSFGIPAIATNVGATSEIVNQENGILLGTNPDIGEVKSAIDKFYYMDKETFNTYRRSAYYTWKENYNAEKNYPAFINEVMNLKR